jgi:arabinose-5-phosphate isomerase
MTRRQLGVALVVHRDGRLLGTFTDGDLRRLFERVDNPRRLPAREAFEHSRRAPGEPRVRVSTVGPATPAVACLAMMRESQITHLVVVDSTERPVGLLRLMDLMTAGLG